MIVISTIGKIQHFVELFYKEELEKHYSLIEIDYVDLAGFLQDELNTTPFSINFIQIFDNIAFKLSKKYDYDVTLKIVNYPLTHELRLLDKKNIGEFITCKVMIKNITQLKFKLVRAVYECKGCGKTYEVNLEGETPPSLGRCAECGSKAYTLLKESSTYENYKYVKLVEPLEMRNGGETREFKGKLEGYLASPNFTLKAGDVCDMAGTFDIYVDDKTGLESMIDIYHIKPLNTSDDDMSLTDSDVEEIKAFAERDDAFEVFTDSIAPAVLGYEYIKEALVLQLFEGGRPSEYTDYDDRYTIHILLIGDVGLGKSKIIEEVYERSPRAIKSNGAGSTQGGLTAVAVRDEILGVWTLDAGAVVLADQGILVIDEFDKLSHKVMKSLNEPMEQLSCSVSKAGLVQTMSARTSILAGANPKYSKFDPYKQYDEQLNIPQSTISRFDLIFAMVDNIDYDSDYEKARMILSQDFRKEKEVLDKDFIKKYTAYAKNNVFPTMDDIVINKISQFYARTRQLALHNDDVGKPISMREMGAIQRLSIARAKLSLREYVTESDVDCAIRIYTNSLESLGLSLETAGAIQNIYSDLELKLIKHGEHFLQNLISWDDVVLQNLVVELIQEYDVEVDMAKRCTKIAEENIVKERENHG